MAKPKHTVPAVEVTYPNGDTRYSLNHGSRGDGSTTRDVRGYEARGGFVVTERSDEVKQY
jgi:hypothetical protein